MKTIDILNKIANGEEPPKKIIWKDKIYNYNEYEKDYYDTDELNAIFDYHEITDILNDEVEILEITITYKPDKIGKIDVAWQNVFDEQAQQDFAKMTLNKINEIIEAINER